MIKLKDILNEGKQPLNEVIFYGSAKVVLQSKAKDAQLPSQLVGFKFNYVSPNFLGKGPTLVCIPASSKDLDKIDSLVGFFLINEKPTSSKDPFALRRAAIGLLRVVIENKLSIKLRDLIIYSIRLYEEQGVKIENEKTEIELLDFLKERMRNILKLKNVKVDIIEASISSHRGDNYLDLCKKTLLMNKYINKDKFKNLSKLLKSVKDK